MKYGKSKTASSKSKKATSEKGGNIVKTKKELYSVTWNENNKNPSTKKEFKKMTGSTPKRALKDLTGRREKSIAPPKPYPTKYSK
jgi:hypothetical protein